MSCPNNLAPGNFLMDSLMGSSFRSEAYSGSAGMYSHAAADYGYAMMRNIARVGPSPLLHKRDEAAAGGVTFQDAPYLSTQLASWSPPGSKSGGDRQPVAQCLQPCSFLGGNVKEEAFCCLYQDGSNKGKQTTTESATYIRLGDNSCRPEQTATSSKGCFQVYDGSEKQQQQLPPGFPSVTPSATSAGSESQSTVSCSKTTQQETTAQLSKTDEKESRREEKAKSDSCSENSDEESKGRWCASPSSSVRAKSGPESRARMKNIKMRCCLAVQAPCCATRA